jgi:alpha-mannosidase
MCERARRLTAMRGLPAVNWDQPEAFFARLAQRRAALPSYVGECYLEFHRGTYTTHSGVKAAFRSLERALQTREAVAVATAEAPDLGQVWRRMVFAQFHDYVPGSSIPDVYVEGVPELQRHAAEQRAAAERVLTDGSAGKSCVFNPLPLPRLCVVEGRLLRLPPLAGVEQATATVTDFTPVTVKDREIGNGLVSARINLHGELVKLTIKGEPVDLLPGAGQLVIYPDRAASYEAWDIDRQALALGTPVRTPAKISWEKSARGIRAALVVERSLGAASTITLRYELEANSSVLRVEANLDWHEPEALLKLHFATGYRGSQVRCGAPFGSVLRPQQPGSRASEAMWEIPASRHVSVTDDSGRHGFSVITEAKYGFTCRDGNIGVSLVRSPRMTGFDTLRRVYPPGLSRVKSDSIYSDQGKQRIALAITRFDSAAPREQQPAALADLLFTPPIPYRGSPVSSAFKGLTAGETLVPCWAKPSSGKSWTLRLHEVSGERGIAQLALRDGWQARRVDLRGLPLDRQTSLEQIAFAPYEIVSLEISQ